MFQDSKDKRWWNFFTRKGFEHVDLFILNNDIMTCISPSYDRLNIYSTSVFKDLKDKSLYDNISLYEVKNFNPRQLKLKVFMLGTCVGICKKFLGIKKPLLYTPYQLYKYLEKKEKLWQIHLPGEH